MPLPPVMKSPFKFRLFAAVLCALLVFSVAALILVPEVAVTVFDPDPVYSPGGEIVPQILDGMSMTPIEGAEVVIVETGGRYRTKADGKTEPLRVPVIEDKRFSDILKKPWGEITLIVHKDGYADYVLFYAQIWENQRREGPRVLLFKADEQAEEHPFSVVEGPQRLWVNALVKKFIPGP